MLCVNCHQIISIDEGHRSNEQCIAHLRKLLALEQEQLIMAHELSKQHQEKLTRLVATLRISLPDQLYKKVLDSWAKSNNDEGVKNGCSPNTK
jgi:hypothetical protein